MIARWIGDPRTDDRLAMEQLRDEPDFDGEMWQYVGHVRWNKSRTLFYVERSDGDGPGRSIIGETRDFESAKRRLIEWAGATSVAPLGSACPLCHALRVKSADLINYECPSEFCRRKQQLQRRTA